MPTAIIIGGGVIGLSTAYHLALAGYGRITVLEKGQIGDGSSSRAAGITTGLLWSETGVRARQIGIRRFREISRELDGYHFHDEQGCLNLFNTELWPARQCLLPLYDRLQTPYEILTAADVHERWPDLHPPDDFIGLHDPQGGYSEPVEYLQALVRQLEKMGVDIRCGETVTDLRAEGGRITGVTTRSGVIQADVVVASVHVWSLPLLKNLNLKFPIKHFVHQRYLSNPLPRPFNSPPVNADPYGGYIRPAAGGRLLLGLESSTRLEWPVTSRDFNMKDVEPPADEFLTDGARLFEPFVPGISDLTWEDRQVGLLSFSMDGEPILGPVQNLPGLMVAVSFHSGGFSYNTAAGFFLAEWITKGETSVDLQAFSPDRFDGQEVENHLATQVPQNQAVRRRH